MLLSQRVRNVQLKNGASLAKDESQSENVLKNVLMNLPVLSVVASNVEYSLQADGCVT